MATDLSIVIVNYNVKYFLEQCLHSVRKALHNISCEIFVVDNNSVDGSCAMIRDKFPEVRLIENDENLGFSKANNQAIRLSSGRYILLLNPDTVIEEHTLTKCLDHMENNPATGALGVRMIDGKGNFLPESKRSFPTPRIAFFKIFGFSRLFPKSRIFSRYHLGYLDENKMNEVEVLPGAFMMLRKSALDKVGLLDEDFFMYGEDIDISYRMIRAGYRNIYFPDTTIIHYKGESTRKGSMNYVITFYRAMIIFARKHFSPEMAKSYTFLINIAIYFRAFLAIARRFIKNIAIPLLEASLIYLGFHIIKPVWESYKFHDGGGYPSEYMLFVVPAYIIVWMVSLFFSGAYDRPFKLGSVIRGILAGTIIILIIYALLPESLRYSRALLLIGSTWALTSGIVLRMLAHISGLPGFELSTSRKKRIIIIGSGQENERVESLLKKTEIRAEVIGFVSTTHETSGKFLGQTSQLPEIIKINRIDEIIFCAADISSQKIISTMMNLSDIRVSYKIAPPESLSIIGSNSINTAGDLYLIDFSSITKSSNRRNKRLFDIISSILLLATYPVSLFFINKPWNGFINIFRVLSGLYTWIGYYPLVKDGNQPLPIVKRNILTPVDGLKNPDIPESAIELLNTGYAKNYNIFNDARILMTGLKHIGRPVSMDDTEQ
jgi:GT2 family glycosyltransferase